MGDTLHVACQGAQRDHFGVGVGGGEGGFPLHWLPVFKLGGGTGKHLGILQFLQ